MSYLVVLFERISLIVSCWNFRKFPLGFQFVCFFILYNILESILILDVIFMKLTKVWARIRDTRNNPDLQLMR